MGKPAKRYSMLNQREKNFIKEKLNIQNFAEADKKIFKDLKENLKKLKDARMKGKILYKLWDVIICVIIATIADNNTWEEIHQFVVDNYNWFKRFLQMTGGIPTTDSYERIMSLIDSKELNQILVDFFSTITLENQEKLNTLNFDGRVNNGSKREATMWSEERKPLNCLNVYSNRLGMCVLTKQIDTKTNEIPTVEEIIQGINLKGYIVTWDALNTQVKNAAAVIRANGDYIVPIKGNHGTFFKDLQDYFDEERQEEIIAGNSQSAYLKIAEKSHSAIITYECFQTEDIHWYSGLEDWEGIRSFGLVKKTIEKEVMIKTKDGEKERQKKVTIEYRYYISSRQINIKEFYEVARTHWNIENKIHFHLDYTFLQDKNNTLNKPALLNLEIVRKFVLGILDKSKNKYNMSLRGIRKHIGHNMEEYFPELICCLIVSK